MEDFTTEKTHDISNELKCKGCGATLKFAPGTNSLKCDYCGAQNEIAVAATAAVVEEIDFEKFLSQNIDVSEKITVSTVKCQSCGASTTLKPNITSDMCPFCGTSLVIKSGSTSSIIKPKYLLPFAIEQKKGFEEFKKWIKGLWFAPNDLKQYASSAEKLAGMYIPYWTYDSDTTSAYSGERGDAYYVSVPYTTTMNGKTVTQTRSERRIRWTSASGTVYNNFDDVLVIASNSLPRKKTQELEPWDLTHLVSYDDKFLSGFRSENYQVDVKSGFEDAKKIMYETIQSDVKKNIGGDEQRVHSINTSYSSITFKHILLPIWISAYKYNNKVFRFMINGRTGEVQGERPWSVLKIIGTVLLGLALIAAGYFTYKYFNR